MEAYEAIMKRRAIRQFKRDKIDSKTLIKIADAGGLAPTAANLQPLRFLIIDKPELSSRIFETLHWAGYLPDWAPPKNKQPAAYIFILVDSEIRKSMYEYDVGLAAGNIMVAATSFGLGSCCLAVSNKEKTAEILGISDRYLLSLVIALGYSAEKSRVEEMKESVKYFRDEEGILHVPKRKSDDIIHVNDASRLQ